MPVKTYFWIEDSKAGYMFWQKFMQQLCPEIVVEGKKNSSELVRAVRDLGDSGNKYIIAFDNSFDNLQAIMEWKLLKRCTEERDNIFLLDIICFEYLLLEFKDLINWIYVDGDEFIVKRAKAITAREKLVGSISSGNLDYKDIREIMEYDRSLERHNIEQLAAKLLFDLTRNTGFEVSKGAVGECWIKSCCDWEGRQEDDICGLDGNRMSLFDKMKAIYEGTSLEGQFQEVGLEVAP